MTGALMAARLGLGVWPLVQCALLVCTKVMTRPAAPCLSCTAHSPWHQGPLSVSGSAPHNPSRPPARILEDVHIEAGKGTEPKTTEDMGVISVGYTRIHS